MEIQSLLSGGNWGPDLDKGNLQFSLDLYQSMCSNCIGNMFFSPFSIALALAMTLLGAGGQTALELKNALGLNQFTQDATNKAFLGLINSLKLGETNLKRHPDYTLLTANRMYVDRSFPIAKAYETDLGHYYLSNITAVDFHGNPDGARKSINAWVEEATDKKIKDLCFPGTINTDTALVLVNAIYFKAGWVHIFDEESTKDGDFYVNGRKKVKVPMMTQHDIDFPYTSSPELNCKMVELDYVGERLAMYVILPFKNKGVTRLEQRLSPENFHSLRKSLTTSTIDLILPKFKLDISYDLVESLKNLGIKETFIRGQANFTTISPKGQQLFVSNVNHKAFIEVNEKGTEAAAASGAHWTYLSYTEPLIFKADHPFLFVIYDKFTETILFMGRLSDPTATTAGCKIKKLKP